MDGECLIVPLVSVIILNFNGRPVLRLCLEGIQKQNYPNFEVIVVDNGSVDGSIEMVRKKFSWVTLVVNEKNLGYAEGNNQGVRVARGEYVVFLNNDAYPKDDWLSSLVKTAKSDNRIGIVGSKVFRGKTDLLESAGGWIEYPLGDAPPRAYLKVDNGEYDKKEEVAYVSGAAFLVKKDLTNKLGCFDSVYFCYHEETDLCWRARLAGYAVIYDPNAVVYHYGSFTTGKLSARKIYWQSRNRIMTNIKNLEIHNLISSIFYEIANFSMVTLGGLLLRPYRKYAISYLKACVWVLFRIYLIIKKRAEVQRLRKIGDEEILRFHKKTPLNIIINRYLQMVRAKRFILFCREY